MMINKKIVSNDNDSFTYHDAVDYLDGKNRLETEGSLRFITKEAPIKIKKKKKCVI